MFGEIWYKTRYYLWGTMVGARVSILLSFRLGILGFPSLGAT